MRVHHINCGSILMGLVSHCLLIELKNSIVLVDTGFGTSDLEQPQRRLGWTRHLLRPELTDDTTAIAQVKKLGYQPSDVTDIVLTHLDYDHTGGLSDFPDARVHVHGEEFRAAMKGRLSDKWRYRAQHWEHNPQWVLNELDGNGDKWFDFDAVRPLSGLGDGVAVIPLYGHTAGHVGIAIDKGDGWLLHAGDAFISNIQLNRMLPGLQIAGMAAGAPNVRLAVARTANMFRLAKLAAQNAGQVEVFSAHDPIAFHRMSRHHKSRGASFEEDSAESPD